MSEQVLNEAVVDELLAHCENATEKELVGHLRTVGYPVTDFLVATIRMAAAAGGKEMFVELGNRGLLPAPEVLR